MAICVRLQDLNEKPSRAAPKYIQQARVALLKKAASGQVVTWRMLRTETQRLYRLDYKAWHKRAHSSLQLAHSPTSYWI